MKGCNAVLRCLGSCSVALENYPTYCITVAYSGSYMEYQGCLKHHGSNCACNDQITRFIKPCFCDLVNFISFSLRRPKTPLICLWPFCLTAFARTHIPHHPPRCISHICCANMTKTIGKKQHISSPWCQLDRLSQVQGRKISI